MNSKELRQNFIDFFTKKKEHVFVRSSSVVPIDDPTLIFTNAGMNQFKDIFLGETKPTDKRAVNSQKCIRVSGKHNDLEEVGVDNFHHTFFEMLGTWSFGDYYKNEAIEWAWEYLTEELKLDKSRLWVTVYKDDQESEDLWKELTDINHDRVLRFDEKDNFWEMGETGPCGPCTEIHYFIGEDIDSQIASGVNSDDLYREIWNLVFIQYNRDSSGKLIELPIKHVDTGMGLERLLSTLNGITDHYQTDLFSPIIKEIETISSMEVSVPHRVIADHLRMLSFSIADGAMPSNEGRGYVIRRVLRRASRYGRMLNLKDPFIYKLVDTLCDVMGEAYPEIISKSSHIKQVIKSEESSFLKTLDKGIIIFEDIVDKLSDNEKIKGIDAFKLYDTYGFPLDLTEDILKNKSLKVDHEKFQSLMKDSRELAKKNWKGSGDSSVDEIWFGIKDKLGPTEFLGYETNQAEGIIISLLKNNKEVRSLKSGDEGMLITNQTPFYGESGGQVGDTGHIISGEFKFEVTDVQKKLGDLFVHYGKVLSGNIKVKDSVELKINIERRNNIRAYHSATHLLHESLRRVLGSHVIQKGSLVEADRLRFDFSHIKPISSEEINKIEIFVNSMVSKKSDVKTRIMTPKEAVDNGALALFGEKYGDEVRVLSMGNEADKYFSTELCGGTHVRNTGDIGKFKIVSQSSIAAGVRRVEALREKQLQEFLSKKEKLSDLSSKKNEETIKDLSEKIIKLGGKVNLKSDNQKSLIKDLTKQFDQLSVKFILSDKLKNIIKDETINNIKVRFQKVIDLSPKDLRKLVDIGKQELGEGIVIVFAIKDEKIGLAVGITNKLTSKFDAVKFVETGSEIVGGKGGGGRADFAQAGGVKINKIDEAFEKLKSLI